MERNPLTARQQEILEYVASFTRDAGYPPTVREIGRATGLRSPRSVSQHLHALEKKGFIHRGREKSRAIRVLDRPDSPVPATGGHAVPLLMRGRVVAGESSSTADVPASSYLVDRALFPGDGNFLMRVDGECMVDAHILPGDMIVVSPGTAAGNGDVVVARIGAETSVKRFEETGGMRRLVSDESTVPVDASVRIVGRVVGLIRSRC
ncbi:MAG TPA: transcriptional repressor LexA [Candidatus Krumholzibacteria bacterium]|nr:transcriptional repressor LexA [Candidatus Krumholzibacteria bacterium]